MKNLFAILCIFVLSFCSSTEDSSITPTQPPTTTPSTPAPSTPTPSTPTYYCSINGATYYEEAEYRENCVEKISSSSFQEQLPKSSSSIREYCCERTGNCYPSQELYDIQCATPPWEESSSSQVCTKCECNKQFQEVYSTMLHTAACAGAGGACKTIVARQVGCEL